jgi:uncharacterized membrane protein
MLHSIKHTAIQLTAVALLTAGATFTPFATNAIAAPAGAGADRGYTVPSDEDSCVSSPGSINHTPCNHSGGY